MYRTIRYERRVPRYDEETRKVIEGEFQILNLEVTSDNDKDFNEQLETIKSYDATYTIEEIERPLTEAEALKQTIEQLTCDINKLKKDLTL